MKKHFQEDKQPPCFSFLVDQTTLSWLSNTLVHSQITMNCQQQLQETTACCKTNVLDCVWELRADYLTSCRDVARWYQPRPNLYTYTLLFWALSDQIYIHRNNCRVPCEICEMGHLGGLTATQKWFIKYLSQNALLQSLDPQAST